jgi:hypothetical protein
VGVQEKQSSQRNIRWLVRVHLEVKITYTIDLFGTRLAKTKWETLKNRHLCGTCHARLLVKYYKQKKIALLLSPVREAVSNTQINQPLGFAFMAQSVEIWIDFQDKRLRIGKAIV